MSAPFVVASAAGPPKASRSAGWSLDGTDGPASGRVASNLLFLCKVCCKVLPPAGPQLLELMFTEEVGGAAKREGWVFTWPKKRTYNIADSHVVTQRSTSATQSSLTTEFGMESGSFCLIWS